MELTSVDALDHTVIVFGIVRPCRHRLSGTLFSDWMAHLCGLCLTLRELHGQAARLVTNYDAVLISVLVEAQRPSLVSHRSAGPCPFRKLQCAEVVDATAPGARLAAAASLILAAGKIRDHINDRDGAYARLLVAASSGLVAKRMQAGGERTGKAVGFDTTVLTSAINRQTEIERSTGLDLVEVTEPTETAVSATFAHTAVLAGQPYNYRPLAEIGRQFGRIAHLLERSRGSSGGPSERFIQPTAIHRYQRAACMRDLCASPRHAPHLDLQPRYDPSCADALTARRGGRHRSGQSLQSSQARSRN